MNTFKSKPRKCKEKNLQLNKRPKGTLKTENGETEVFVLPPDLLQKLGINLESVDTIQESSVQDVKKTDVLDAKETAATEISIQKEPTRDSSILKTADLMKTSVLLSPTFATSVNINPGELEIAHVSESITNNSALNFKTDSKKQDIIELVSLSHIDKSSVTLDHQQNKNAETRIMYEYSKNKPEIDTNSLDRNFIPQEIQLMLGADVTDILGQPTRTASTDEHPDEAYSSDCSNSNCGPFENSEFSNYIPTERCYASQSPKESPNQIKILSEEILKPSQINEIKIMYSPKRSAFIPVSINSVLEPNKHTENINNKIDCEIVSVFKNPINCYSSEQNKSVSPELVQSSNNSEVVLFDEKGKPISTTTDDIRTGNSQVACGDLIVLKDVCMESLLQGFNPETHSNEHTKQDVLLHENSFGVCIDFVATDIEMHLKEDNEDILENFVNEMTSNDNNGILKKIEESELDSPVKTHNTKIKDMQHVTNIQNFVEKYNDYNISNNYLITEKNPVKKNKTHNDVNEIARLAIDKNDFEAFEGKDVSSTCQNICERDEESNKENNVIDNRYKSNLGVVGHYSNLIQETIETNKDSGIEDNNIHCTSSNINVQNNYSVKCKMYENTSIDIRSEADKSSQSLVEVVVEHIEKKYEISAEDLFKGRQGDPKKDKEDFSKNNDIIKENAIHDSSIAKYNIQKEKQKFHKNNEYDDNVYVLSSEDFEWNKSVYNNNETETKTKTNSTNKSAHKGVTPEDKVTEIATYLSQFAKNHASLRKSRTESINFFEKITKRFKQNPLKSKMYIHGVEKPGGSVDNDKNYKIPTVLKTYNKSSKPNKKPGDVTFSSALKEIEGIETSFNDLKEEQNINEMAKCNDRTPEFCNCSDFGRKAFYDSVCSYEHLHFWQRNIVDCDLETLFSIYRDSNEVSSAETQIENVTLIRDQKEDVDIMDSICWHYFENNQVALNVTKDMQASDVGKIDDLDSSESAMKESGSIHIVTRNKSVVEPCVSESCEAIDVHKVIDASINLYGLNKVSNDAVIDITDQVSYALIINKNMVRSEEPVSSIEVSSRLTDITMIADNTYKPDPEIKMEVTEDIAMNETVPLKSDVEISRPSGCQDTNDNNEKKRKVKSDVIKKSVDVKKQHTLSNSQQSKRDMSKKSQNYSLTEASTKEDNDSWNNSQSFDENQIEQNTKLERKNHNYVFSSKEMVTSEIHITEQITSEKTCETTVLKKLKNKSKIPKATVKVEGAEEFVAAKNNLPLTKKNISKESFDDLLHRSKKIENKRKRSRINYSENDDVEPSLKRKSGEKNKTKNSINVTVKETTVQEAEESEGNNVNVDVSFSLNDSICAVCQQRVSNSNWMDHIAQQHDYLAWKDGENPLPLDDDEEIRQYLMTISKQIGNLKCSKCGLARKYPKAFMQHIRNCTGAISEELDTSCVTVVSLPTDVIKCGVCNQELQEAAWISHIQKEHDYLAWKIGQPALDKDDVDSLRQHLNIISKQNDGLICIKCGTNRRYANSFLHHIKQCTGEKSLNVSSSSHSNADLNHSLTIDTIVKCGVCQTEVASEKWIQHIHRQHEYMAWKEGETLDLNNKEEVEKHLSNIVKQIGYLACGKCGMMRKYIKNYLEHVNSCSATPFDIQNDDSQKKVVCAICLKKMDSAKWSEHKMEQHYNVAWTVGSIPVNFKSSNVIDVLIKEYRERHKKMKCKVCGITRASCIGFYAHVVVCGKSEEEADIHRDVCQICHKKYLYVYQNQHMAWHREQEFIKEVKMREADQEEKVEDIQEEPKGEEILQGRRAAHKARSIIQKFKSEEYTHECPNCQFGADCIEEIQRHVCNKKGDKDFSDSEDSVHLDSVSEDESDDSEFNSDISDEQETERKREREYIPPSSLLPRFPYTPKHPNAFFSKSGAEFRLRHYTNNALFPTLRRYNCEVVPDECLSKYLPSLEESCNVQFCDDEWVTYKRFEAKGQSIRSRENHMVSCPSIFVGACIQCMAWAPPALEEDNSCGQFLAVACHRGADVTRINADETLAHPGLIQLWNFGKFSNLPKLELGIAHDFGVPWAMDWCPSGARDVLPEDLKPGIAFRLGLLAVAFSNGYVYIFSVPYPSTVLKKDDGKFMYKLEPVMELRLTMNSDRKIDQATSISWSPQKNHESIVVGYSDGTMAFYDITTDSPLLKSEEKGLTVIFPYHDEKSHNTCITGVGLYPGVEAAGPAAVLCSSSSTGAALVARPGVRPTKQQTSAAVGGVQFQPLWPSVLLVGDEGNMSTSISEIEFWACGRRMGGASAAAGCQRCGRLVLAALPLLRARTPHPAKNGYRGKKQDIFAILQTTPLSNKPKKLQNDELQMKIEPTTYEDAIKKYGIEFKMDQDVIKSFHNTQSYPERIPERFPLGDVPCMAFCQSQTFHKKLAVASHAGVIFLVTV